MNVTLIPLFLAASVSVNENDWKYGPEVIYDATMEYVTHPYPEENTGIFSTATVMTKLKCRPKSRLVLSCNFREPKVVAKTCEPFASPREIANVAGSTLSNDIIENLFELNYEKNGLESIVISSPKSPRIEMIRSLVGQLDMNGDFSNISVDKFKQFEDFTIRSCKTNYVVSGRSFNDKEVMKDTKHYDLMMLIKKEMPPGEVKEIFTTRNLHSCGYPGNYVFRSYLKNQGTTLDKKIKSSKSLMILSNRDFTSWTENFVIARMNYNSNDSSITTMQTERTILKLEKIVRAGGPLPTIRYPVIVDIYTTPNYDDYDIENPPKTSWSARREKI